MADSPPLRQREGREAAAGSWWELCVSQRACAVRHRGWGLIRQTKVWAGGWDVGEEERRSTSW